MINFCLALFRFDVRKIACLFPQSSNKKDKAKRILILQFNILGQSGLLYGLDDAIYKN